MSLRTAIAVKQSFIMGRLLRRFLASLSRTDALAGQRASQRNLVILTLLFVKQLQPIDQLFKQYPNFVSGQTFTSQAIIVIPIQPEYIAISLRDAIVVARLGSVVGFEVFAIQVGTTTNTCCVSTR